MQVPVAALVVEVSVAPSLELVVGASVEVLSEVELVPLARDVQDHHWDAPSCQSQFASKGVCCSNGESI